jgi:hypothetical protein
LKTRSQAPQRAVLETILKSMALSRANSTPICRVQSFSAVTMAFHGQSKYSLLDESSGKIPEDLWSRPYESIHSSITGVRDFTPVLFPITIEHITVCLINKLYMNVQVEIQLST